MILGAECVLGDRIGCGRQERESATMALRMAGVLILLALILGTAAPDGQSSPAAALSPRPACTSFCLDNGDHCVFGANQDNPIDAAMLAVKRRQVLKTAWEPSTTGEYARWISRYGSVTFDYAGYQLAWAGMNEVGLMMSTMALYETENPAPDSRPPLQSPLWMQFLLDSYSTVKEVIASDALVRIKDNVDHFLICDSTGDCAVIEFLEGKVVYHTGESLPVAALTNHRYQDSVKAWQEDDAQGDSLGRFASAADRVMSFEPTSADSAVDAAFDTLAAVARHDNAWRIVFDPANLQIHFRTNSNPQIRTVDFAKLDFSCDAPILVQDIHAELSGDISDKFAPYSHRASVEHTLAFLERYERTGYPPLVVEVLIRGMSSFPCRKDAPIGQASTPPALEEGDLLIPPPVLWAGLAIFYWVWPVWVPLTLLSLAYVAWRMARGAPASWIKRLAWVLAVLLFGPLGLLVYLLAQRRRHRTAEAPSPLTEGV
jgi:penicillin V acylase-like amidase (Ntn superfamily)